MFSQQNSRFTKRSKKKTRQTAKRARSRKLAAAFESLEARQLLTAATVPWVAESVFNQYFGEGGPTAVGLGIKDGIGTGSGPLDMTPDKPGFIGFEIVPGNQPCSAASTVITCGSQTVSGGPGIAEKTVPDPRNLFVEGDPFPPLRVNRYGGEGTLKVDSARIGIEYGFYANAGTGSLLHDGNLRYEIQPQGDGMWKLSADATAEYGSLRTISPTVSAYADFIIELEGSVEGQVCFVDCVGGKNDFDLEGRVPLVSLNRQDVDAFDNNATVKFDGKLKVLGLSGTQDLLEIAGVNADGVLNDKPGDPEAEAEADIDKFTRVLAKAANEAQKSIAEEGLRKARAANTNAKAAKGKVRQGQLDLDPVDTSFLDINLATPKNELLGRRVDFSASAPLTELTVGQVSATSRLASVTYTWPEINLLDINQSQPVDGKPPSNPDNLSASTDDFIIRGDRTKMDPEEVKRLDTLNDKRKIYELDVNAVNLLRGTPYIGTALTNVLGPFNAVLGTNSIGLGPLSASFTGLDYDIKTAFRVNQTAQASAKGDGTVIARFKDGNNNNVTLTRVQGAIPCPTGVSNAVCFTSGTDISFDPPNIEDLQVEFELERDFSFKNNIGMDIDVSGTLTILKLSLEAFGMNIPIGPAFSNTHTLAQSPKIPIFEGNFDVTQKTTNVGKLDPITIDVRDKADLAVQITDAPRFYLANEGEKFTVDVDVKNNGPNSAAGFCLSTDVIKTGLEIVGGGICSDGSPGIQLGPLADEQILSRQLELRVTSTHGAASQQVNDVIALSADFADPSLDSDPNNNKATLRMPGVDVQRLRVNKSKDTNNAGLDCGMDSNQACSLREAIAQADSNIGPAVIEIMPIDDAGKRINPALNSRINVRDIVSIIGQGSGEGGTVINGTSTSGNVATWGSSFFLLPKDNEAISFSISDVTMKGLGNLSQASAIEFQGDDNDSLIIDDVSFVDNKSTGGGGAILAAGGFVSVRDSHFENNVGRFGGAINVSELTNTKPSLISGSTFQNNRANEFGGAIAIGNVSDEVGDVKIIVEDSVFSQNQSPVGAAIGKVDAEQISASVELIGSYFYSNDKQGGSADNFSLGADATVSVFGGNLSDDNSLPFEPVSEGLATGISQWQTSALSLGARYIATNISTPLEADIGTYDAATGGGVTYEFIYNVPAVAGESSAFMGSRNAPNGQSGGLKFDQWRNSGTYGATEFGVADYLTGVPHTTEADTHVVFVADGTDMHLYVNGEFAETMDGASFALSGLTGIGHAYGHASGDSVDPLDGTLLGVSVYDVALDASSIQSNFDALSAVGGDRLNTNLFDISGVGRPPAGVDIQEELPGAVVGAIVWNGPIAGLANVEVGDSRFEVVANVLKLKDGEKLGESEEFEITLTFTDQRGEVFDDTLKLNPGSLPDALVLRVDNPDLEITRNDEGEFVFGLASAQLEWNRQLLTGYDLQVTDAEGKNLVTITEDACDAFDAFTCGATIEGLPYFTDLTYTLTARNKFGAGAPAVEISRTRIAPPTDPQDLKVTPTATELTLTWTQDAVAGRVGYYEIEVYGGEPTINEGSDPTSSADDQLVLPFINTITLGDTTTTPSRGEFYDGPTEYTLENLEPNTERTFVIVAYNSSGVGLAQVAGQTLPAKVTEIPIIQVQEATDSSATLVWNLVDNATSYQVIFGATEQEPEVLTFNANATSATIEGLAPNTTYGFTVIAANVLGESASAPVTVTTANGPAVFEDVTSPGDEVIRVDGENDGDSAAGLPPASEDVDKAFDNTTDKHLNFLDLNSGVIVTPQKGATVVTGVRVYTANDWVPRDPASYKLEGLNASGTYETISEGPLDLPSARNASGQDITSLNPDTVVDVVSAQASSFWGDRVATNLIDGSGLDATGDSHDEVPENMWLSAANDESPSVTFEFGEETDLTEMRVWNYTEDVPGRFDLVGRAVARAQISILKNGTFELYKIVTFNPFEPSSGTPHPSEVVDLRNDSGQPVSTDAVRIDIVSNHNGKFYGDATSDDGFGNFTGLAEVQFFAKNSSNSLNQDTVWFENSNAYSTYRLIFPTLKDAAATNSMQVAEIELLGTIEEPDTSCGEPSLDTISDCAENLAQRDELLARLDLLLADLNGDGNVGFADFLILSASFGEDNQGYDDGDIDLDGTIGFADFLVLSAQFGKSL